MDVDNTSITATTEFKDISIVGNSTMSGVQVNGTSTSQFIDMPGEALEITGVINDPYDNQPIVDMTVDAQWEDFGIVSSINTTGTGTFTVTIQVPITVNSSIENGTIYLDTYSTTFNSPTAFNFTIDVFVSVQYSLTLNLEGLLKTIKVNNSGYEDYMYW